MLRWFLLRQVDAFDRARGYDSAYVREMIHADPDAALRFSRVMGLTTYRKGVPADACYAAALVGTLTEDCGPCTQLVVSKAEVEGVPADVIRAIVEGDTDAMPAPVRLAYRFAHAVLQRAPEADALREEVVTSWGQKGLISLSFAVTMARFFPTLKSALGHARACQRIRIGKTEVSVHRQPQVV